MNTPQAPSIEALRNLPPEELIGQRGEWAEPARRVLLAGKPETYTDDQWSWLLQKVAQKHIGMTDSLFSEPNFAQIRDHEGNTLAHWGARFHRGLAMKALKNIEVARLQEQNGFTVAEVAGRNWAKAGMKILETPELYELSSPDTMKKGPKLGHQMIAEYGRRTEVIQLVLEDPALIAQALDFQQGGHWIYQYLRVSKQSSQPGARMERLEHAQLLKLLQATYPPLRTMVLRHMGETPQQDRRSTRSR